MGGGSIRDGARRREGKRGIEPKNKSEERRLARRTQKWSLRKSSQKHSIQQH